MHYQIINFFVVLFKLTNLFIYFQNVFVCVLPSDSCQYCVQHGGACRKISGVFVVSGLSRGSYNPLLELPPRACSINITEIAPSNNYIGCTFTNSLIFY